jgi:carbon monoxide dehydrogenase subunit G
MSALVLDYSAEVRISAPLQTVWAHLSDLNYILRFVPETDEFLVHEDGIHASCDTVLIIGPVTFPIDLEFELADLTFEEKVTFKAHIPSLQSELEGSITLRRASAHETSMKYRAEVTTQHKVLRRLKGATAGRLEEHVDGFCSNAAVFIGRHAQAEDRLLGIDE